MKYGLPEEAVSKILAVLSQHPEIDKAILYGARALGTEREGSDIDITFVTRPGAEIELGRLASELDDCNLPYLFDLSSYSALENPQIVAHIAHHGLIRSARLSIGPLDHTGGNRAVITPCL